MQSNSKKLIFLMLGVALGVSVFLCRDVLKQLTQPSPAVSSVQDSARSDRSRAAALSFRISAAADEYPYHLFFTGMTSSDLQQSVYVENADAHQQEAFVLGADVWGYALKEIFKNHIILSRNGKDYSVKSGVLTKENPVMKVSENKHVINLPFLLEKSGGISNIAGKIILMPYVHGGKVEGLRVVAIADDMPILSQAGVVKGDVIRLINGSAVQDFTSVSRLYREMNTEDHFEINVLRNGKEEILRYRIIR
jgi:type II secretion system protein C